MLFENIPFDKITHLPPAQKKALKYILEHYQEAIFLTASKLSRKAGVSEATVVRLAQVLGFYGYPGMQEALRENLQDRLSTVTRMEKTVKHMESDKDVLVKIMQEDIHNLSQTMQDISVETFYQAVSEIQKARRIFVAGLRGAHAPAVILAHYLLFLKKDARLLVPGIGDVWNTIYGVGPEDLVIGISFPRYTRLTVEILEYASEQGARVGAITDSLLSPLAEPANWVLPVHSQLDSFFESFTAAISLVNALVTAISIQDPDKTMKALSDREALWKTKDIYLMKNAPPHSTLPAS